MTLSPSSPPIAAADVDAAIGALRSSGLRLSSARRLVIEALAAAEGPVSAEQVASGIGGRLPRSDLASVYRNLETLEQVGVVRHLHLGHGPALYALAGPGEREYLACEACGDVRAVDPAALEPVHRAARDCAGWTARFSHFPLTGLCPDCARDPRAGRVTADP
jgi:Fur family transcriptional regulator, ferric uptake regulator